MIFHVSVTHNIHLHALKDTIKASTNAGFLQG